MEGGRLIGGRLIEVGLYLYRRSKFFIDNLRNQVKRFRSTDCGVLGSLLPLFSFTVHSYNYLYCCTVIVKITKGDVIHWNKQTFSDLFWGSFKWIHILCEQEVEWLYSLTTHQLYTWIHSFLKSFKQVFTLLFYPAMYSSMAGVA